MIQMNLDIYFSTSSFGVESTVWDVSGSSTPRTMNVIFDVAGTSNTLHGTVFYNENDMATCKTTDAENINSRSAIAIDGVLYNVIEVERETGGTTILKLSKDGVYETPTYCG